MEVKYPGHMIAPVFITGSQLLEYMHITELQIIMLIHMIVKPGKETVLVKIIIQDLFPEINMHFIIQDNRQCARLKAFFT